MNEWVWSIGGIILTGKTEVQGEKHYAAWLVDEWMSMEHWWNYTDRGNWSTGRKTLYSVGGRWMNECGALVEWYWQGKTGVLGEKHYTARVGDGWISMEQWWNDTDRGKLKYWEKNLSQCHSVHHKSQLGSNEGLRGKRWATDRLTATLSNYQLFSSIVV